jgi:hypothetical protein
LEKLIEDRVAHGDKDLPPMHKVKSSAKAVDLVAILQRSIQQTRANAGRPLIKEKKTIKNKKAIVNVINDRNSMNIFIETKTLSEKKAHESYLLRPCLFCR